MAKIQLGEFYFYFFGAKKTKRRKRKKILLVDREFVVTKRDRFHTFHLQQELQLQQSCS